MEHVPTKAMGMIWGRGVGGRSSWCKSGKQGLSCPVLPGEFGELFTLQTSLFLTFPFLLQTHPDLPSFSDTGANNLGPHFAMATLWHANSWPLGNILLPTSIPSNFTGWGSHISSLSLHTSAKLWLRERHEAQSRPISALCPSGCSDWYRHVHLTQVKCSVGQSVSVLRFGLDSSSSGLCVL